MNIRKVIKSSLLQISALVNANAKSKVLYYHDIYDVHSFSHMATPLNLFKSHVDIIRSNGFEIKKNILSEDNQVMICLDDGFRGIYSCLDFFLDNQIYPTIFLAVDLIGKDGYLKDYEIKELDSLGFRFQCHSWSHKDLTTFSIHELKRELSDSKNYLSDLLNKDINEICFPKGYYSDLVIEQCEKYGYNNLYTSVPGKYKIDKIKGIRLINRNIVQSSCTKEVELILKGGYEILRSRYTSMHYKEHSINS